MRTPNYSRHFKRDLKRAQKRGKDITKLKAIIAKLSAREILAPRFKDHMLIGNYKGRRECHIEPDWLLIYKLFDDEILFERTGTHSDLFK